MTFDTRQLEQKAEVLQGLGQTVSANLSLLASPEQLWQPTDYLPDLTSPDYAQALARFRTAATQLSDETLVILVGGMITEEALPNYAISLNLLANDPTGTSAEPWAQWMRGWIAEENRHGDILNAYLRFSGRVDMRAIEMTIYHLLRAGFNPRAHPDPYGGLIYTSFQERATRITHGNVGRLAAAQGDAGLAKICQRIAGDESRHEVFYSRMMAAVFEADSSGAILSMYRMLRGLIAMPGRLMTDGRDPDLFDHFANVAQRTGVYTALDYAQIIRHLVDLWKVAGRTVSGPAARAQEYLCRQAERYTTLAEGIHQHVMSQPAAPFSWVHGRKV